MYTFNLARQAVASSVVRSGSRACASNVISASRALSTTYHDRIDHDQLTITKTTTPKKHLPMEELAFGRTFTDHMLEVDWNTTTGWGAPRIVPYGDIAISPAATGLHYGIQCFEGMKAYKDADGNVRLFRPQMNMARLNKSMTRLAMPRIDLNDSFLECIKELVKLDANWIPDKDGYSMYLRPCAIGTAPYLGVHASEMVKLFCIASPVGPYYKNGFAPIRLLADTENARAWPGGVGNAKVGGNYGPTILPSKIAQKEHGCDQILWLFGNDHHVTEVGAMNIFFAIRKKDSDVVELITPPLSEGHILEGVTRDSMVALAQTWPDLAMNQRNLTMAEIVQAEMEGRLLEVFGTGTAAVISPVREILYRGQMIKVPTGNKSGPIAMRMWNTLMDIQYGRTEHHGWSQII